MILKQHKKLLTYKVISTFFFTLLLSISAFAQRGDNMPPKNEKLKTLKIAHITEKLDLTEKEAQVFWPIYNQFDKELQEIRSIKIHIKRDLSKGDKIETVSEEVSKKMIKEILANDIAEAKLKEKLVLKLEEKISYKKILKLIKAEESFKRKILNLYRDKRRKARKEKP